MATKIIDAIVRLKDFFTPNMVRIRQELSETQKAARRASQDIKNIGSTVSGIGKVMLPAATAITGGIGYAAKQFADFSYSITRTAHVAGASAEELEMLKQTAISVGSVLPMTINETSQAMFKLAQAGFDSNLVANSIKAIGMAAEASGADISLVSDTVSNAMSVWSLKQGDIAANSMRVADVIQQATNKSKMNYEKFAVALQSGGNIAASFGESIEDVTALMGALSNLGIAGSRIGTTLGNAYMRLASNTSDSQDQLRAFGIEVLDSNGNLRSMIDILNELHAAMKGKSDDEVTATLKSVFSMYAVPGIKGLIQSDSAMADLNRLRGEMGNATNVVTRLQSNIGGVTDKLKEFGVNALNSQNKLRPMIQIIQDIHNKMKGMSETEAKPFLNSFFGDAVDDKLVKTMISLEVDDKSLKDVADSLENFKGKSEIAFNAMQNTFGGKIKLMMATFDKFVHHIGDALEPLLTPIIESVTGLLNKFNEMDKGTLTTILKLSMGLVALTGTILAVGAAFTIFGKFTAFLLPIGAQLASGATVASFFASKIASISLAFTTLKNIAGGVLSSFGTLLLAPLRSFGTALGGIFTKLLNNNWLTLLENGVNSVGRFLGGIVVRLGGFVGTIANLPFVVVGAVSRMITAIRGLVAAQGIFGALTTGFRALGAVLVSNPIGLALLALVAIIMFVATNWQTFKQVAETVWNKIKFAVSDAVDSLKKTFGDFKTEVSKSFDDIVQSWNKLTGSSETSSSAMSKIINTLGSAITATVIVIVTAITEIIKAVMIVVSAIVGVFSGIIKFITGVFTANWSMVWEGVKQVFMSIFGGIGKFFMNIIDTISEGIDRIRGKTTEAALAARELEKKETQRRESWNSGMAGDQGLARASNAMRGYDLSGGGGHGGSFEVPAVDTSKAQAGLDSVGEASKANAEAIQNNANATENFNINLLNAGASAENYQKYFNEAMSGMPEDVNAFGMSIHEAEENFSGFNTDVGSSKQALQDHATVTSTSKDAIQQLADFANIAKDHVKLLGEMAFGAVENVKLLGERAGTAAISLFNIDGAAQALVTAFRNTVDSIANMKITAPTVAIPVATPLPADNNNTTPSSEPGHNFIGTNFWRGGITWVHEQGPELIDLPRGTRIVPHSRSLQEEYRRGYDTAMLQSSNVMLPFKLGDDTTKNPSSKLREAEDTGNANSIFNEEFVNNPSSIFSKEFVSNPNSIFGKDFVSNASSIFAKDTVNNASSNIGNETVSNPQSNIDVKTVSNANSDIKEISSISSPSSIFRNDAVGEASSNIQTAADMSNAQSDIKGNTITTNLQSKVGINSFTTNPQTSISTESVSNAQSNIHSNNQGQNVYAPNMNFTIAKIADTLVIREEADISRLTDRVINKFAFWFQAHANNRVVGAVR